MQSNYQAVKLDIRAAKFSRIKLHEVTKLKGRKRSSSDILV